MIPLGSQLPPQSQRVGPAYASPDPLSRGVIHLKGLLERLVALVVVLTSGVEPPLERDVVGVGAHHVACSQVRGIAASLSRSCRMNPLKDSGPLFDLRRNLGRLRRLLRQRHGAHAATTSRTCPVTSAVSTTLISRLLAIRYSSTCRRYTSYRRWRIASRITPMWISSLSLRSGEACRASASLRFGCEPYLFRNVLAEPSSRPDSVGASQVARIGSSSPLAVRLPFTRFKPMS